MSSRSVRNTVNTPMHTMHCVPIQQGKRWSNEDILQILDEYEPWLDITATTTTADTATDNDSEDYSTVITHAAHAIAAGSVIGWYQGRSEFGPRALGSRSILGDPRGASTADYINAAVKKREDFRPFAPSVLLEYASEWFHGIDSSSSNIDSSSSSGNSGSGASPYMSITVPVKDDKRSQVSIQHTPPYIKNCSLYMLAESFLYMYTCDRKCTPYRICCRQSLIVSVCVNLHVTFWLFMRVHTFT
jgi:Carbamoyltransferase C-terminus